MEAYVTFIPQKDSVFSPFGDQIGVKLKPIVSVKATYGVTSQCETFTATGGGVTTTNGDFVLTTGTSVGGYGVLWSRQPIVYQPGVGIEARGTARFTAGVASSIQTWGLFSSLDGMFFGYNGTSFGIMHRQYGELEIRTLTVTAGSGGAATVTVTLNGVAYTASITAGTTTQNAHEIEAGLNAGSAASLWNIQHIGSTVVFVYKGAGAKSGAYSATPSAGTFAGTFSQVKAGAEPTETWTAKESWNADTATWLDPTKTNLFKVEFAYLGYGPLNYYIFNPSSKKWALVHSIPWSNAYTRPNFTNPSMRIGWVAASLGGTTNLTVAGANSSAFLQGDRFDGRPFAAYGTATGVTTATQVLTIQVRREYGSRSCDAVLRPTRISVSTDSTKGAVFKVYRNPTVAGTTAHAYVDQTESIALYDTAGTTVSGGRILTAITVGPSGTGSIDMASLGAVLIAGDELVITGAVTSGAASQMDATVTWEEIV